MEEKLITDKMARREKSKLELRLQQEFERLSQLLKSSSLFRYLRDNEELPGRVRVGLILVLILLLSQVSARFVWSLATPLPEIALENVVQPTRAGLLGGEDAAQIDMATGERLAKLNIFGQSELDPNDLKAGMDAPATSLQLSLNGVLAAGETNERGIAIIAERARPNHEEVYGIGDRVPGNAVIEAIMVDRVVLSRAGRMETLYLEGLDR